jgi:hypothetical protein
MHIAFHASDSLFFPPSYQVELSSTVRAAAPVSRFAIWKMPRGRITMEKIQNEANRQTTFSKRKAGIMKKVCRTILLLLFPISQPLSIIK